MRVIIALFLNPKQDLSVFCVKIVEFGQKRQAKSDQAKIRTLENPAWRFIGRAYQYPAESLLFLSKCTQTNFFFQSCFHPFFGRPFHFTQIAQTLDMFFFSFASCFSAYLCFFYSMTFVILANSEFVLFLAIWRVIRFLRNLEF